MVCTYINIAFGILFIYVNYDLSEIYVEISTLSCQFITGRAMKD